MNEAFSPIVALLAVAFIIYLSYLFSGYISKGSLKFNSAKHMQIIDRLAIGQDKFIMIIKVSNSFFLISAASGSIKILKKLPSGEFEDASSDDAKASGSNPFMTILKSIMKDRK